MNSNFCSFNVKFMSNICNGLLLGNASIARRLTCCKKLARHEASRKSWSTKFPLGGEVNHIWPLAYWEKKDEFCFFYIWKLERKKNEEIKGRINRRNLVLFHIKQQMIHNTCIKLQNPTCNSSWEIFVTHFPMYYIGVRDGQKEK